VPFLLDFSAARSARSTASLFGSRFLRPRGLAFTIDVARTSHVAGVPLALLGHTQAPLLGIAQLAVVGGVPLLSALVVAVNLAIAQALSPNRTPAHIGAAAGGAATCLALALGGVPLAETLNAAGTADARPEPLRALLVRHRTSYEERWIPELQGTHLARLALHTERELRTRRERPDLVVWPENSLIADLERDAPLRATLLETVKRLGVDLVFGTLSPTGGAPLAAGVRDGGALRSQALWISPQHGIVDAFAKTTGVPIVEATGTSLADQTLRTFFGLGAGAPVLGYSNLHRTSDRCGVALRSP
jgi:apolipoprotein N-acyltransferase